MRTGARQARSTSQRAEPSSLRARDGPDGVDPTSTRDNRRSRRRRRGRRIAASAVIVVMAAVGVIVWLVAKPGPGARRSQGGPHLHAGTRSSSATWRLAFRDEFSGTRLSTRHWATCYWWATTGCTNQGNHELEWYQPANVQVGAGALQLTARRERAIGDGKSFPYTSGLVATIGPSDDRFSFRYGFVETRVRVPAGTGFWPAFWMLPTSRDAKPEVDVFEILGDQPRTTSMHVHWRGPGNSDLVDGAEWTGPDFTAGWHTFGLDWEPDGLTWYVDGVERWRVSDPARIPREPMYLIANLAVGGDNTRPPTAATRFPSRFLLDYVRVWHRG